MAKCKLWRVNDDKATLKDLEEFNPKNKNWVPCTNRVGEKSNDACDECIDELARSFDPQIRALITMLPTVDAFILERLTYDRNDTVATSAKQRLKSFAAQAQDYQRA